MRFAGKSVIVTGAGSGIGLAVATRFASEGASVVMADRSAEKALTRVEGLKAAGAPEVIVAACDVSKVDQVEGAVAIALERLGRLDVVVNNAGMMTFKTIEELTQADWLEVLGVDFLGAVHFTREAFRAMKPGGAIVNVASVHAVETSPLVAPYAAAKAAMLSLTRTSSIEGKPKGLRANAVLPGAIDTPMLWDNPNIKSGAEVIDASDVGKPEEVAAVVAFLASDEASFMTGAAVNVDGGRLARL